MFVKDYMQQHPIMIDPNKPVAEAQRLLTEHNVYYLPVVNDGKRLEGMITPPRLSIHTSTLASLDVWEITRYLSDLRIKQVMIPARDLITISPDATIEDAAALMIEKNMGGLVVVEDGTSDVVLGLITDKHLLIELRNLLGAIEPGWRVTIRVPGRRGEFTRIHELITENGWGIMTVGNVRAPKAPDQWDVVVKIWGATRSELTSTFGALEGTRLLDIRETEKYG